MIQFLLYIIFHYALYFIFKTKKTSFVIKLLKLQRIVIQNLSRYSVYHYKKKRIAFYKNNFSNEIFQTSNEEWLQKLFYFLLLYHYSTFHSYNNSNF